MSGEQTDQQDQPTRSSNQRSFFSVGTVVLLLAGLYWGWSSYRRAGPLPAPWLDDEGRLACAEFRSLERDAKAERLNAKNVEGRWIHIVGLAGQSQTPGLEEHMVNLLVYTSSNVRKGKADPDFDRKVQAESIPAIERLCPK